MIKQTRILFVCVLVLLYPLESTKTLGCNPQKGCVRLDQQKPAQIVSYDSLSNTDSRVSLRLYNNTNCTIAVETDDHAPVQMVRRRTGGLKLETVDGSSDGIRLDLHYLVHSRRQQTVKPAYGWGDSVFTYKVLAGQSILFKVPLTHFKKRLDIAVPFTYEWEGDSIGMNTGGVVHRVYFLFDALPQAAWR